MHFAQASMLHWFWAVVVAALVLRWLRRRREDVLRRFAAEPLLPEITPERDRRRLLGKDLLIIAALFFSIVALARPQWGFQWQHLNRRGLDILLVVDISKSMLTADVKPNRLERTKLAVQDLLKKLQGDRVGLIAFAGDAFMVCPLTVDYSGFLLSLHDLDTATVGRGGTNIARAVEESIRGYDAARSEYKAIILVTDGDNLEGDALAAARKAKDKGVKIYTIGVGTPEGELIQFVDEQGQTEFLKDNAGNYVKSRLNESLLQQIALTTGGIYRRAAGAEFGLDFIYESELAKLQKRDIEEKMQKRYHERFQIPLTMAFLALLLETCLSVRKKFGL